MHSSPLKGQGIPLRLNRFDWRVSLANSNRLSAGSQKPTRSNNIPSGNFTNIRLEYLISSRRNAAATQLGPTDVIPCIPRKVWADDFREPSTRHRRIRDVAYAEAYWWELMWGRYLQTADIAEGVGAHNINRNSHKAWQRDKVSQFAKPPAWRIPAYRYTQHNTHTPSHTGAKGKSQRTTLNRVCDKNYEWSHR